MTSAADYRGVTRITSGIPATDGAGVRMTRLIGTEQLDNVDPFLLLDSFRTDNPDDYIAGFPAHPHRGFETVTYMFAGLMRHKDSVGNEGVIETGGVQWMTAGRGIVHSEMPEQKEGLMWGTQLWVNLPAAEKMSAPAYQEFDAGQLPREQRDNGVAVVAIAGATSQGTVGAVKGRPTEPIYFDVRIPERARYAEAVPASHSGFIFVVEGAVVVDTEGESTTVDSGQLAILGNGDTLQLSGAAHANRILLIAGRSLNEPIARGGPFVMNTRDEIRQAFNDYQSGNFLR
ncbi:MAG: pirin family protein [Gammaproteobacteria bacterium]|nr:pirin family protein [Gammaproteobacteria bacterium]